MLEAYILFKYRKILYNIKEILKKALSCIKFFSIFLTIKKKYVIIYHCAKLRKMLANQKFVRFIYLCKKLYEKG